MSIFVQSDPQSLSPKKSNVTLSAFNLDQLTLSLPNSRMHKENLAQIEDDLNTTEDGEAGKKTHGASNQTQLTLQCYLFVPLNLIIGCCVKVNQNIVEIHISMRRYRTWERMDS